MILLVDEPGPKGVYKQSQILGNEAAAYSFGLRMYYHPLLSKRDNGLGRTRCSVLNSVPHPAYYMYK